MPTLPERPIVIWATPRSGSSMTAGIFHAHGVWFGKCREGNNRNIKGFFENLCIKRELNARVGMLAPRGRLGRPIPEIHELLSECLKAEEYPGGPWAFKGTALYHPIWAPLDPIVVCCRRSMESTLQSCLVSGIFGRDLTHERMREILKMHHDEMDKLNGLDVDTKAVASGDYRTIRKAIEGAGLSYDEEKVRDFVRPALWHH